MGWCMREPYCPLSSAVCDATIPTLPSFEMAESLYIRFLSRMRDWTVAVAQYSKFTCSSTVYLKIWLYNNLDIFTYLTMIFN